MITDSKRSSKFPILLILPIVLSAAIIIPQASAQQFTIENFHSDIIISESGTVDITETIEVVFDERKHGIYREIPFQYRNDLGDIIVMPIKVKSVLHEDGSAWTNKVSKQGNVVNIRIGDADRYVRGRQIYVINYEVDNALLFFDDHDEFYWNVTGDRWRAKINSTSATVRLGGDKTSSEFFGKCYTGRYGSTQSDCTFELHDNRAIFQADGSFRPGEGFTIAVGWDKGIVSPPSAWQKLLWKTNLTENWVFCIPVLVLILMITQWYRKGRDPRVREAMTVMYEPPEINGRPLPPAQVGALVDESLDQRDLTSSIIGLAIKGYIELHEEKAEGLAAMLGSSGYTLVKLKEPDDGLSLFEQTLMNDIFPGETSTVSTSEFKNSFYKNLPNLRKIMFSELVKKKFFSINPSRVKGKYGLIGFGMLLIGTFILYLLSPMAPWKGVVSGAVSGIIIMAFSNAMPAKTRFGAMTRMHILGFREFMNRADRDRLERMGKDIFYKYLPYAIALDVTDNWIDAFRGMLTEQPSWYVAARASHVFSPHHFSQSISSVTSHLGSTMFSAPRGSGAGGGGGGSSGGGGGGGGGGSW